MARLCPLFSGSSGNSYYIGSRSGGVLIDCGRSARQTEGMLRLCGIDPLALHAIFVTHEHTDHTSGIRVFAKKFGLPVYASPGTLEAIAPGLPQADLRPLTGPVEAAGMILEAFPVSHDCIQPVGYRVHTGDGRSFCLATDLGCLSEEVKEALRGCDAVVLESNHDVRMLETGPYPYYLKRRILSDHGHLSNDNAGRLLNYILHDNIKHIFLGHLSKENNFEELACETVKLEIDQGDHGYKARDFSISVARRDMMSEIVTV